MLTSNELKDIPQPKTPKSTAKDKFGFNQKDITELIKSNTLEEFLLI